MKIAINVADWRDSGVRCLIGTCQIAGSGDGLLILDHVAPDTVELLAMAGVGVERVYTFPRSQEISR